MHGVHGDLDNHLAFSRRSPWVDIVREFRTLSNNGIDLLSLVKKKVGNGVSTSFWDDVWLDDSLLKQMYPRIKDINALSNLYVILANEGFENVKLSYLGGQWVLLYMDSTLSKEKIANHRNTEDSKVESVDPQYPLGFTPDVVEENDVENSSGKFSKPNTTDKVMGNHGFKFQASSSILEVMDELIKVGQTMSYNMDGCVKNIEAIIGTWIPHEYRPEKMYEDMVNERSNLLKELQDLNSITLLYLAIRELLKVLLLNLHFQKRLSSDQNEDLERNVSYDEIKKAVWDCRTNISYGPDGFTFEFYRRYWKLIDQDVVVDVNLLFDLGSFPHGYNSSFITLIPKTQKVVKDFRPISLIGSSQVVFLASGLKINLHKSKLMGIGVSHNVVVSAARSIGCLTFHTPFTYLVVKDDVWLDVSLLKQMYPRLYLLEGDKHSSVAAKLSDHTLSASFRRHPRGGIEYSVESTLHLFFSSHLARQLMLKVARWWELKIRDFISCDDWLGWLNNLRVSKRFNDVFEGICYTTLWIIWKFHNQVLFGRNQPRLDLLFDEIVRISLTWCSSRRNSSFDWGS
nr:RNA-directed DNA polymerase, eukaryota, reverse transcriptase zinc-binding domain protein [Tanacetum cinerariifolium]